MNIGDKIKSLRKEKGLSQEDLAKKCGLNRNSIYKYEKNETTPKLNQIKKIAAALDVEANELTYWLYYDEIHKEQSKNIRKEIDKHDSFTSYLKSFGYDVTPPEPNEILESHVEEIVDSSGNVIGEPNIIDKATCLYTFSKNGKYYVFTDKDLEELQNSIQEYIDFQISRKSK
ncbi:helix-turn-helix domain-containing protein [Anaeroarcus burkinensis]|uniref:helix-turn-helix domain-containing protein n=1 Tax=Anaeroarcus burkinensis TaxID=82376 RepID=UPI00041321A0|nr:helix-turn-helix transcriptional regulator [Anaeroarcus burkinensis]